MDIKSLPSLYGPMTGLADHKAQPTESMARALSSYQKGDGDPAEARKAGKEFESYFIAYLIKEMRTTVHSGLIKNKEGQEFYSLYDQEIGRLAAESGGLGLSRMLEQTLARGPRAASPKGVSPNSTQVLPPFSR